MSKQVICINPGNYRLTRNQEYTVTEVPGRRNYYNVINDAGRSVQYSSELFEDVSTTTTNEEVMASLNIRVTDSNVILTFNLDGEDMRIQVQKLTETNSNISCGVKQLAGVNAFITTLVNNTTNLEDRGNLRQQIINEAFRAMLENTGEAGMMTLSTNENTAHFELADAALTALSATTHSTYNPNSGNQIKLWVIDVSGNFEEPDDENTE